MAALVSLDSLVRKNLVKQAQNRETYWLEPLDQRYAYYKIQEVLPKIQEPTEPGESQQPSSPSFDRISAQTRAAQFYHRILKKHV